MKKYLSLIVLCATSLIYGDGFENLKALQNQFHGLIYNAGDLGADHPAPEVPYIAGLLTNPVESIGESEGRHIYELMYDKLSTRNRKAVRGIDEAKADAFNTINFDYLTRYNHYQHSGHSVFGIAAQELPLPIQKVVMNAPAKPTAGGMPMGLLAVSGGANPFAKVSLNKVSPTDKSASTNVSSSAAAVKPLHNRVQDYITTLKGKSKLSRNEGADLAILQELEEKSRILVARVGDEKIRYDDLVEFFGYLENPPAAPAIQAKVGQLRMKLKPKDATVALPLVRPASNKSTNATSIFSGSVADDMVRRRKYIEDEESDDEEGSINLEAINVAVLDLGQLKQEKNRLRSELEKVDEFDNDTDPNSYPGRIRLKIQNIDAKIKELQPQRPVVVASVDAPKLEMYLDNGELEIAGLSDAQKGLYKQWRDEKTQTPEAARIALNSNFPPKYEGESYNPNLKKATAVPAGGGGRRGSVAGGLSKEEKAARRVEIETRIAEIEQEVGAGTTTTMKGNKAIAELRQELSKLG